MTIPDTMRAARLTRHGGAEALELATVSTPSPAPGEVLVRGGACALNNTDLTVDLAGEILADSISSTKPRQITAGFIIERTAEMFNLEVEQLQGKSRTRDLVHARQVGMYVCRELTDLSYPQIGKEFGGRDHTTVIHAYDKISNLMQERRKTYEDVTSLIQQILSGG